MLLTTHYSVSMSTEASAVCFCDRKRDFIVKGIWFDHPKQ